MGSTRTIYKHLTEWWAKGILASKLRGVHGQTEQSMENALYAISVGLVIVIAVQFFVVALYARNISFNQLLGVPLFAVVLILKIVLFILTLYVCLLVVKARPELSVVASLTCYAYSGALPLLGVLMAEQLREAIRLFIP